MSSVRDFCKQNCAEREATIRAAKSKAQRREKKLSAMGVTRELLEQISLELLRIAQKHISAGPSSYSDAAELLRCARILKDAGLQPVMNPRFTAAAESTTNNIVTNSITYRYLRNKSIAGFATIAELTDKPAAIGSADFQKGVREGYRRASDIAVMFLDDIQIGGV